MAINMNWTQIIATVAGGLILALQGVNITQGVAISGQETRIEKMEEDITKANYELNKMLLANQEAFKKKTQEFDSILLANQNEFRENVKDFEKHFEEIKQKLDALREH